ncbi:hypothetical protein MIND_01088500 [Mycena indigotica]|uniref:Uncharacterized protein n=1 Tax=Mycena indigotica TaxID=2126181 RepID=A0A8H6VXG8_9AGAR|nr:uncharacterized protein MIND_01088500 [Mycena indigotica]KAF7295486.1 hypothetical protein MIND_01088500 [Mycena indigotica]
MNRHLLLRRAGQIRFKATIPPRQPRADLASIPHALRELLPQRQQPDPNAPPAKRRGLIFYLLLVSPLFIWMQVEKYFDPKPLLEKKRQQAIHDRLLSLRATKVTSFTNSAAVVAYLRSLFAVMLPPDLHRHMRADEVCGLLEEQCPPDLLVWLQEVCAITYRLSQISQEEDKEIETAEKIEDSADAILRRCYQTVHHRLR